MPLRRSMHVHDEGERGTRRDKTTLAVPKGPQGERHPTDVIGCAVHIARIATGEIQDTAYKRQSKARAGRAGARARSASLTPDERSAIARKAVAERWR